VRALVTGGVGFIGTHLVATLLDEGWEVVVVDRVHKRSFPSIKQRSSAKLSFYEAELSNRGALKAALDGVDVVFHLAWTGENLASSQDLKTHVEYNLLPSLGLFELCQEHNVQRVVFLSSGGTVYGPARHLPITEDHPCNPISPYGMTKLTVEHYLKFYDLDYVVIRPSVPYGEWQNPFGVQGAVAVFLGKVLRGEPIVIWGDGSVVRDYFYIGDLAQACVRAATAACSREVFNIGGGKGISLKQLIDMVGEVSTARVEVEYQSARPFDVPRLVLDISKASNRIEWRPRVGIQEGLERTWRWMREWIRDR